MDKTFNFLKEGIASDMAAMLIDKFGLTPREALDTLYDSKTYAFLSNKATQLYTQSPLYVFTFLEDEIRTGRFTINEI